MLWAYLGMLLLPVHPETAARGTLGLEQFGVSLFANSDD